MRSVWCEAWGGGFKMWGVRHDVGLRCEVWSVRYWVKNVCLFLWLVQWQHVLRKWGLSVAQTCLNGCLWLLVSKQWCRLLPAAAALPWLLANLSLGSLTSVGHRG